MTNNYVLDIIEKTGYLWLATDGGGINRLELRNEKFTNIFHIAGDENSLPVNSITVLYKDSNECLLAGSVRGGVFNIKERYIRTYKDCPVGYNNGLSEKSVTSFYEEANGKLWIGTDGGGTYWYSSDGQEFSGSNAGGFSDFFEQMFGHRTRGGGGANAGFRGQDYHADLNLSLREAAKTHKQILTVNGKQVRITSPAGVANGQVIKLKGYGGEGINGGPAGDLYITFVIPDDSVFKRLGDDLYVDVTVDLYTALLGGDQLVDTLDGQVKLKVKPETQNGTKVRLKGKGFPVYKKEGQFGDLIVTYSVKLPTNLTEQQKEMLRKIQSMN